MCQTFGLRVGNSRQLDIFGLVAFQCYSEETCFADFLPLCD